MKIAVDAMGGDLAPQAIVEGVIQATSELPSEARIVLIGRESAIWEIFSQNNFYSYQSLTSFMQKMLLRWVNILQKLFLKSPIPV